ncbi:glycoside hydrolase family 43 protein [Neolewinella litorea]|uniref:Glycosyl hydrolase 43 family protein n=1 Tax=Neolewinella litorea TaxID=2562452 RepID=A0A4S4NAY6_9BACT|nr:glycoside hydrolase 43 family protein [Neolewinella litorea]THH36534.1 glycosyl hydrolase 43 family protein [Neolewinella litorea]
MLRNLLCLAALALSGALSAQEATWTADNGNGTFTNPLFYEEFSDPDLIRVGDDYYLTGTTMHTMPGLPVLHSRDLVNWELLTYAADRLDLGPEFRLEEGKDIYGQGFWAPCLRYHEGTFYIFSNVNGQGTQIFTATDPAGPWRRQQMRADLHDLTVLFDDDGKKYAVWGYREVKMVQLTDDLLDVVPGTERVIVEAGSGAGEGSHIYKVDGKYYITNTNYDPVCYQVCLRADQPYGPYEVNVMSAEENLGVGQRARVFDTRNGPPFNVVRYPENYVGCIPMHQGGIVQTQTGEWWGWSMMDYNSVGRLTALSPVTWQDGWPYLGLPGNLTRSPRTWVKPNTGSNSAPAAPFRRDDTFDGPTLNPVWQWNHMPDDSRWSLTERPGYLRLHALPAESFWRARNSLTQRAIGPESTATAEVDVSGLRSGDVGGLGLLNLPYAWIGVAREGDRRIIRYYNQQTGEIRDVALNQDRLWLRAHGNFETDTARLSYSLDGKAFQPLGGPVHLPYQLRTFQGVRYALFNFNRLGKVGGQIDVADFTVDEPRHRALTRPIPYGRSIRLTSLADSSVLVNWRNYLRPVGANTPFNSDHADEFRVLDRGQGRVALQSVTTGGFLTVRGSGGMAEVRLTAEDAGAASTFQWQDMLRGDLMLMSLATHRYLSVDPGAGSLARADARGARPDRRGGACFLWELLD